MWCGLVWCGVVWCVGLEGALGVTGSCVLVQWHFLSAEACAALKAEMEGRQVVGYGLDGPLLLLGLLRGPAGLTAHSRAALPRVLASAKIGNGACWIAPVPVLMFAV